MLVDALTFDRREIVVDVGWLEEGLLRYFTMVLVNYQARISCYELLGKIFS